MIENVMKPSLDAAIWRAARKKARQEAINRQETIRQFAANTFGSGSVECTSIVEAFSVSEWTEVYAEAHAQKAVERLLELSETVRERG